jgi:hypothetical protein
LLKRTAPEHLFLHKMKNFGCLLHSTFQFWLRRTWERNMSPGMGQRMSMADHPRLRVKKEKAI